MGEQLSFSPLAVLSSDPKSRGGGILEIWTFPGRARVIAGRQMSQVTTAVNHRYDVQAFCASEGTWALNNQSGQCVSGTFCLLGTILCSSHLILKITHLILKTALQRGEVPCSKSHRGYVAESGFKVNRLDPKPMPPPQP